MENTSTNFCESSNKIGQKISKIIEKSFILSPSSISCVLSLIHLASGESSYNQLLNIFERVNTFDDIEVVKQLCNNQGQNNTFIKLMNCVLIDDKIEINKEYMDMLKKVAEVLHRNFEDNTNIATECNKIIETNTNSLIKDCIDPLQITLDTRLILINTIYFKSLWSNAFVESKTKEKMFNNSTKIMMMMNIASIPYYEDDMVQIIFLSYVDNNHGFLNKLCLFKKACTKK